MYMFRCTYFMYTYVYIYICICMYMRYNMIRHIHREMIATIRLIHPSVTSYGYLFLCGCGKNPQNLLSCPYKIVNSSHHVVY